MPRENSFTDSEGRSLTSDESDREEGPFTLSPGSPTYTNMLGSPPNSGGVNNGYEAGRSATNALSKIKTVSRKSIRSRVAPTSAQTARTNTNVVKTPKERFRGAVHKVMAMRRGTSILGGGRGIGAEPGVDPRRASANATYGHIHQECHIEIVDYSAVRSVHRRMNNAEFVDFMDLGGVDDDGLDLPPPRDPWVKVRWINIGGMSWDVIKGVSIRYNLHPLALEDVFHGHSRNRSKADYYTRHLFLRVLCHELADTQDILTAATGFTGVPRSTSPEHMRDGEGEVTNGATDDDRTRYGSTPSLKKRTNRSTILPVNNQDVTTPMKEAPSTSLSKLISKESEVQKERVEHKQEELILQALKKDERINVHVAPMFLFLFRDGTIISIHPTPSLNFTAPISLRLRARDTILRKSAEPSILVHSLLDLVVDRSLRVVDEYHIAITKYENAILMRPSMKTVRRLHILSGDLILHKRTLEPIKTLVYGLRRYDVDRCAALIDSSDPANKDVQVVGFMSHKSKIYLADVYDHMEYILTSLDMFAGIAENLINYSFNISSYEMNETMRRLTLATIICLPLTILTGYFGMNFDRFWAVHNNSDLFFWELAIPIMIVVLPLFMLGDLKKLWHYLQKKTTTRQVVKEYSRNVKRY